MRIMVSVGHRNKVLQHQFVGLVLLLKDPKRPKKKIGSFPFIVQTATVNFYEEMLQKLLIFQLLRQVNTSTLPT